MKSIFRLETHRFHRDCVSILLMNRTERDTCLWSLFTTVANLFDHGRYIIATICVTVNRGRRVCFRRFTSRVRCCSSCNGCWNWICLSIDVTWNNDEQSNQHKKVIHAHLKRKTKINLMLLTLFRITAENQHSQRCLELLKLVRLAFAK